MRYCIQGEGGGQRMLLIGFRSMKTTLNFDFCVFPPFHFLFSTQFPGLKK